MYSEMLNIKTLKAKQLHKNVLTTGMPKIGQMLNKGEVKCYEGFRRSI